MEWVLKISLIKLKNYPTPLHVLSQLVLERPCLTNHGKKKKEEKLANTAFTMVLSIGAGSPWQILKRVQILLNQGL
jgi:hypothetical protein